MFYLGLLFFRAVLSLISVQTVVCIGLLNLSVRLRLLDINSIITVNNPSIRNAMLRTPILRIFQRRLHHKWRSQRHHQTRNPFEGLIIIVKKRNLQRYGHVIWPNRLSTTTLWWSTLGNKKEEAVKRKKWTDNVIEWTGSSFIETQTARHRIMWREPVKWSATQRSYDQILSYD